MVVQQTQNDAQAAILAQANGNFFSSGIRQKVDRWMDTLWAGGVNNPMDSIEQLSYLLFLRLLSERDDQFSAIQPNYKPIFSGEWSKYAWGNFVTLTGDDLYSTLRDAIEKLHELPGLTQTGRELFRNANLKIYDRPTLRSVVQGINDLDLTTHDGRDMKGDMYEYLLSKLSQSGTNGQFRTPRHIVNLIVQLVNPQPGERIIDPACGTAGFLVSAYNHILKQHTATEDLAEGIVDGSLLTAAQEDFLEKHAFTGYDNDANMVKLAIMNLYLHGLDRANAMHMNPLTTKRGGDYPGQTYDVILANPPFAGSIERESILPDINVNSRNTEVLFMKWFLDHLSENGRAGVIVPEGVALGTDSASLSVRQALLDHFNLEGVISLPHFVFKPYASVSTYILIINGSGPTERTWMYRLRNDGYSKDATRSPQDTNDIPDLLSKWNSKNTPEYLSESGKHRWVSMEELHANSLALAPKEYLKEERQHNYPSERIGSLVKRGVLSLTRGRASAASEPPGQYPLVTSAESLKSSATYQFEGPATCIPLVSSTGHGHASIKRITFVDGKFAAASIMAVLQVKDQSVLMPEYVQYYLESMKDEVLVPLMRGTANVSLTIERIKTVELPIPPLEVQAEEIEDLVNADARLRSISQELSDAETRRTRTLAYFAARYSGDPEID